MSHVTKDAKRSSLVVLLADDELVVRSLAQSVLTREGFRVLNAADGQQALEVSRGYSGCIDVLLTDIKMPRMDGMELSAHVARERPGIKIVFMSATNSEQPGGPGRKMECLRKPFLANELSAKIRSLFE